VVIGADTGVIVSTAADGSTLSFVAKPGLDTVPTTNPLKVIGATSDLYTSVPLTLPTTDSITIAPVVSVAGNDAPGTAPTINAPLAGTVSVLMDKGTFTGADVSGDGATGTQYYKIAIPEAGDYSISVGWDGTSDQDVFFCGDATCANLGVAPPDVQIGSGTANPESSILTLAPGTYALDVVSFFTVPEEIPGRLFITISRP
jgi:hypothetical protein